MATHYARVRGRKVEDISLQPRRAGRLQGNVPASRGMFFRFSAMSGGSRARVPKTETQGRIHTSAATVASCPSRTRCRSRSASKTSSGEDGARRAGGQHVNKTESCPHLVQEGTSEEMEAKCQDERSQHKNHDRAMASSAAGCTSRISCLHQAARATPHPHRLRRSQRTHPHLQLSAEPRHRSPHQSQPYKLDFIIAGDMGDLLQGLRDFDRACRPSATPTPQKKSED